MVGNTLGVVWSISVRTEWLTNNATLSCPSRTSLPHSKVQLTINSLTKASNQRILFYR